MTQPKEKIVKTNQKGDYFQHRFEKVVTFNCSMCKKSKTSKLITIKENDWENKLCNSCFGWKVLKS
jgi:hypothetical protein